MKLPTRPMATFLRLVPDTVHSEVFARLFNHLLQGQYLTEQLPELDGKRLGLAINDAHSELVFQIRGNHLERAPRGQGWDVCIRGSLEDFWLLATRREDPDTLFFSRRLAIEGETETGLYIKNMLDARDFDWDIHLQAVLGPRLGAVAARLGRRSGLEGRVRGLLGQGL